MRARSRYGKAELNEDFIRRTSATKTHREKNFSTYCD